MFCTNCGNKVEDNTSFCPKCGSKLGVATVENEEANKKETVAESTNFPPDLMNCRELKVGGNKIEFTDETGKSIVTVMSTGGGILKSYSFEYLSCDNKGKPYTFMTSEVKEGDNGFTQTAYDSNGEIIGSASYNGGLASMAKTVIRIKDSEGEQYVLEEEVGFIRGLFKILAPRDFSIGTLASARTGKMKIKHGNMTIGLIDSTRGSRFNTYRILDCNTLRERMDLRLVILGMTVKEHHIK